MNVFSTTTPVGLAASSLQYIQQWKKIGAAKHFFRNEYEYEYIMYIDYSHKYIKYQNIMYSVFVTYIITYVS